MRRRRKEAFGGELEHWQLKQRTCRRRGTEKNKREQWHESKKSASDITVRRRMVLCARKKWTMRQRV